MASNQTLWVLRREIPGFAVPSFGEEAKALYKQISEAHASGDERGLAPLVTQPVLAAMLGEARARRQGGWSRVAWELRDVTGLKLVQARLVGPSATDYARVFAQLTVHLATRQTFAAYGRDGALVAGDPGKVLAVEDIWVMERVVKAEGSRARWKLAGRIHLPGAAGA